MRSSTHRGVIASYTHPGSQLGVLIELQCESEIVARTPEFQDLAHDLAMQVAATNPRFIRRDEVTDEVLATERTRIHALALNDGKPETAAEKITTACMSTFHAQVCLHEQSFIKDGSVTVGGLLRSLSAELGETISVARFVRLKLGEISGSEEP